MKLRIKKLGLLALMVSSLAGCIDSGTTTPTTPTTPTTSSKGTNDVAATAASSAAWKALAPQVTVTSVTINSAPVVKFTVKDAAGNPVLGLANKSQSTTATIAGLTNLGFTLAKLVPGADGEPSKWVSYNVLRPPTVAEKTATPATSSCDAATNATWCGTYPTTDTQGTLVDNGDGSYQYTFYRDPKLVASLAANLTDTANGLSKKADFGDLSYDPTLTHRLGIQLGGNAPGSGSNNPSGSATGWPAAVAMVNTANAVYDFRPDGGAITNTRDIVKIDSCSGCHDGKVLAHGSRKDPKYCVTCHTDQIRYSFSMEAPASGLTFTGNYTTGTTQEKRSQNAVVDGRAVGNFPNFMHKLHMGSRLKKQGYNYNANGGAMEFNTVGYPQNVLNCTKCHDGSASAANKTTNGDDWKSVPSLLACGACHDGINFATGLGTTLNGVYSGHVGGAKTNNRTCVMCHTAESTAVYHVDKLPTTADAAKRTMSAEITNVAIDVVPTAATAASTAGSTGTGNVTVTFKLTDNGVPVTASTAFSGAAFTLAKLNPAANGSSTNWQSYTARGRTTVASKPPVITGYSESVLAANLAHVGDGVWTYKFQLLNASTPGDIRTIDHVHNASSASITGTYSAASMPVLPNATFPDTSMTTVSYDWWKTHRVGMEFSKGSGSTAINNKFNAVYDFVPLADSARKAETRNIVSMNTCATCHAGTKLHKGYTTEYCVTCHNQNTSDPATGAIDATTGKVTATPVDLQQIVHKLHMGKDLASVKAGGTYTINGAGHDYSEVGFPGVIKNCVICHSETAKKANGTTVLENATSWYTTPTARACGTCHDSAATVSHIASQTYLGVEQCTFCHNATSAYGLDVKTVHK